MTQDFEPFELTYFSLLEPLIIFCHMYTANSNGFLITQMVPYSQKAWQFLMFVLLIRQS